MIKKHLSLSMESRNQILMICPSVTIKEMTFMAQSHINNKCYQIHYKNLRLTKVVMQMTVTHRSLKEGTNLQSKLILHQMLLPLLLVARQASMKEERGIRQQVNLMPNLFHPQHFPNLFILLLKIIIIPVKIVMPLVLIPV